MTHPDIIEAQVYWCVRCHMREIADLSVTAGTVLSDIGMDSLDRTELAITLEDKYGIDGLTDLCTDWVTAADVNAAVAKAMRAKS